MTSDALPLILYVDGDRRAAEEFELESKAWPVRLKRLARSEDAAQAVRDEPVALVVADHRLADETPGLSLLAAIQMMFPETGVMLYTASASHGNWNVDIPVLFRPCAPEDLRSVIMEAVDAALARKKKSSNAT